MAIRANQVLIKRLSGATVISSATPNQRTAIAHGLPTLPLATQIEVWPLAADDDASSVPSVALVKVDATNVYFKCNMPSILVVIAIWRNKDDFGRPLNQ
jgi:hypothetical protein